MSVPDFVWQMLLPLLVALVTVVTTFMITKQTATAALETSKAALVLATQCNNRIIALESDTSALDTAKAALDTAKTALELARSAHERTLVIDTRLESIQKRADYVADNMLLAPESVRRQQRKAQQEG